MLWSFAVKKAYGETLYISKLIDFIEAFGNLLPRVYESVKGYILFPIDPSFNVTFNSSGYCLDIQKEQKLKNHIGCLYLNKILHQVIFSEDELNYSKDNLIQFLELILIQLKVSCFGCGNFIYEALILTLRDFFSLINDFNLYENKMYPLIYKKLGLMDIFFKRLDCARIFYPSILDKDIIIFIEVNVRIISSDKFYNFYYTTLSPYFGFGDIYSPNKSIIQRFQKYNPSLDLTRDLIYMKGY